MFKMKVEGLREIDQAMAELSKAAAKGALRRAGTQALEPMRALASGLAPKDTGELSENILIGARSTSDARTAGKAAFAAAMRSGQGRAAAVSALRDAQRAAGGDTFVQLFMGTSQPRGEGAKRLSIKRNVQEYGSINQPGTPYMRPAFDAEAKGTIDRLKPLLRAEVDKAVARARARAAKKAAAG